MKTVKEKFERWLDSDKGYISKLDPLWQMMLQGKSRDFRRVKEMTEISFTAGHKEGRKETLEEIEKITKTSQNIGYAVKEYIDTELKKLEE